MKLLLDTNIFVHREGKDPINPDIGKLFSWIDRVGYQKCIHQVTVDEISKMLDKKVRDAFLVKLESYHHLPTVAPIHPIVKKITDPLDSSENDRNDTRLINEIYSGRIDLLLTEDRKIHRKAKALGIDEKVFTIESLLEKITSENPSLLDYKVPTVKRELFGNIDINDNFFDSLREDYFDFNKWFASKSDQDAYVCSSDGKVLAFLYLKVENEKESYNDINPVFKPGKRLKIGTFKVQLNGFKLGERFLKIIFDNAVQQSVTELYVTIFPKRSDQQRLIELIKEFGFTRHGTRVSKYGEEEVYVRDFTPKVSIASPKTTYPYLSKKSRKFLVSIYEQYHTSLFPDSILKKESPDDFIENEPFRNAISKVFVSRSINKNLNPGDIIIFYRTGEYPAYHTSVITTIGIVENVHTNIQNLEQFIRLCRKRSVFSTEELKEQWEFKPQYRPFIVNFLYAYTFPKRLNMKRLMELGIIRDIHSAPRGFEPISDRDFDMIISETGSDGHIIIN
jgi:predicted nucleic acid-binding protein